jgi:hypothetical protein
VDWLYAWDQSDQPANFSALPGDIGGEVVIKVTGN